jgi:hypothetical protein
MPLYIPRPSRSPQDQQTPVDRQNPPRPILRRGSTSTHEKRALVRTNSRDDEPGRRRDGDGGRRSRGRSSSTPPDVTRTRHHQPQDGATRLLTASANASWAYAEHWANTSWCPGRTQMVQVSGHWEMVVHDGQLGDDHRGRTRRSSDANRPSPARSAPSPRPAYSSPSSPVIPGFTPTEGMGLRNLLRKNSRDRPKILFYNKHEPYYGFTNFSPHSVMFEGKLYPTSEHLFQAFKVSWGRG